MSETGTPFHPIQTSGVRAAQGRGLDPLPTKGVPGSSEIPGWTDSMSSSSPVLLNLPKTSHEGLYHRVLEPAGSKHLSH